MTDEEYLRLMGEQPGAPGPEDRIALLERKVEVYDSLILKLVTFAQTTSKGRLMLKLLGLS